MTHSSLGLSPDRWEARAALRVALTVLSVALIVLAYFVREVLGIAFSVAGFIGLFALRLTAGWDRPSLRPVRVHRRYTRRDESSTERADLRSKME
jgi:Na+/H+ antiporter NhaD/arsenite permease-like protein